MTITAKHTRSLPFELGEPRSHRGLTIVPLFPREEPRLEYLGLDEAVARGPTVTETHEAGEVERLLVHNPLDELVLLYEGEELVGAKQNRIVRRTALLGKKAVTPIPVSCVERGRWSYRSEGFAPAPRAAYPELRRAQAAAAPGAAQQAVWANVDAMSARMRAHSPTSAAEQLYVDHAPTLEEYAEAMPRAAGQSGALVGVGGAVSLLDYVGRPEVFAGLYAKLLRGYALEALERPKGELADRDIARFVRTLAAAEAELAEPVAVGAEARLRGGVFGTELSAFGEVVSLTAYPRAA